MTDRELLELAAKAAGIEYHSYVDEVWGTGINIGDVDIPLWNPLTDDSDALRLAVKLRLLILPCKSGEIVTVDSYSTNDESTENARHDSYAATRRAIVRAAAEIGKAMP